MTNIDLHCKFSHKWKHKWNKFLILRSIDKKMGRVCTIISTSGRNIGSEIHGDIEEGI